MLHDVHDLEVALLRVADGLLAGEDYHREASQVGIRRSRAEIGRSGAQGRQARGRLSGQATDDRGHEAGGLLVPDEDQLELLGRPQRVEKVQILFSRDAEAVVDALGFEGLDLRTRGATIQARTHH